jgi:hypothetical protein
MSLNTQTFRLPENLEKAVEATLENWQMNGKVEKLWAKDAGG